MVRPRGPGSSVWSPLYPLFGHLSTSLLVTSPSSVWSSPQSLTRRRHPFTRHLEGARRGGLRGPRPGPPGTGHAHKERAGSGPGQVPHVVPSEAPSSGQAQAVRTRGQRSTWADTTVEAPGTGSGHRRSVCSRPGPRPSRTTYVRPQPLRSLCARPGPRNPSD